jgi:hypothetical protein
MYTEPLEMLRKLLLIGISVLLGRGSGLWQLVLGIISTFAFFGLFLAVRPFRLWQDNALRLLCEVHVFIFLLGGLISEMPSDRLAALDTSLVAWILMFFLVALVPLAFIAAMVSKLDLLCHLHDIAGQTEQEDTDVATQKQFQRAMVGLASEQEMRNLNSVVTEIRIEMGWDLSPADMRTLAWIREELALPLEMKNQEIMETASEQLQLETTDSPLGSSRINLIAAALAERAKSTAQPGVFLSHYQVHGPDVMALKLELEDTIPELAGMIWYDKDEDPSVEGMRIGVRDNHYFVLYLTEGVLLREFCRKEIRWAMHYQKTIVLLWKQDGDGAVPSFGTFFEDVAQSVGDDDGEGLVEIFSDAAVPWYINDADFHRVSLGELVKKLGRVPPAAAPVTFDFEDPPSVFVVHHPRRGAGQTAAIERELIGCCPSLQGRFSRTLVDGVDPPPGSIVMVYLTELLFNVDGVLSMLQRCIEHDMRLVWVGETDMRHGWQDYDDKHGDLQ